MTEQKLNKKLAEWAGFKIEVMFDSDLNMNIPIWVYLDGEWDRYKDLPSFTQSLDDCFKWLVPKLEGDVNIIYVTRPYDRLKGFSCAIHDYQSKKPPIFAEAETPALALCKAIEKLIDSEVKNDRNKS